MTPETTYKPHGNSVIEALPFAQRARIVLWLGREKRTYDETRGLVAQEFGVATSTSALGRFYRRWIAERKGAKPEERTEAGPTASPPPAGRRRAGLAEMRRLACLVGDDPRKVDEMAAKLEELRVSLLLVRADLARKGSTAVTAGAGRVKVTSDK